MYSQYNEEDTILEYFKDKVGTFMDIGAGDGVTDSNTHRLSELGWNGICIEYDGILFKRLEENYVDSFNIYNLQKLITHNDSTIAETISIEKLFVLNGYDFNLISINQPNALSLIQYLPINKLKNLLMLIITHNEEQELITSIMEKNKFKLHALNDENAIYVRDD